MLHGVSPFGLNASHFHSSCVLALGKFGTLSAIRFGVPALSGKRLASHVNVAKAKFTPQRPVGLGEFAGLIELAVLKVQASLSQHAFLVDAGELHGESRIAGHQNVHHARAIESIASLRSADSCAMVPRLAFTH